MDEEVIAIAMERGEEEKTAEKGRRRRCLKQMEALATVHLAICLATLQGIVRCDACYNDRRRSPHPSPLLARDKAVHSFSSGKAMLSCHGTWTRTTLGLSPIEEPIERARVTGVRSKQRDVGEEMGPIGQLGGG